MIVQPTPKSAVETRGKLLQTAFQLFHEQGYNATGVATILREAGVNPGSMYHFFSSKDDLLLKVLHQLRDAGNTIVVIEHNLDVIKTADWLIDMGPEGGAGGGTVVASGTPEDIAAHAASYTGRYLKPLLD